MNSYLKIKNRVFSVSTILLKSIKNKLNFCVESQNNNFIFVLDTFSLKFFNIISTNSSTHYYIIFSNKKFRVSKCFYNFLTNHKTMKKK